jgi:metallophosphoesterase superfamily enzyme
MKATAQDASTAAQTPRRHVVVISDLHFGLGRTSKGQWDAREDFRWTNALAGFLTEVRKSGGDKADLVIAGDFLELWQPPDTVKCTGSKGAICSASEILKVVQHVVSQHRTDLKLLGDFAKSGDNRLVIVPGNHDAALLLPKVWKVVEEALDGADRVSLAERGIWASLDGQLVVEHGHQIGADVNFISGWPEEITRTVRGTVYVASPWGEGFVQKLFNSEEKAYPIIDNLSPESYGARLRLADRGLWRSIGDIAKFIAFNLFETTLSQKIQSLGSEEAQGKPCTKQEAELLGYKVFASALPPDDPFRIQLEGNTVQARELRKQLDDLVKKMSEEELAQICRQKPSDGTLGGLLESTFVPREEVLRAHTQQRLAAFPNMKVFVYAHTHQLEPAWDLRLGLGSSVAVLNTGAFHRLVGEAGYRQRLKGRKIKKASDGLSKIPLDDLAACYSFVEVQAGSSAELPVAATKVWKMKETDQIGEVIAVSDPTCQ